MTSLGWTVCRLAVAAYRKWRQVVFWSSNHSSLCWLCWLPCWMLQDMDNIKPTCVFYVKVSTFTHLEQCKTTIVTVNQWGVVTLNVRHELILSVSFMYYPGDDLRQTEAHVLSLEQCAIDRQQSSDFCCHTVKFIPVNKQTTLDQHIAHLGDVWNLGNLPLYAAGFILSITIMLAA